MHLRWTLKAWLFATLVISAPAAADFPSGSRPFNDVVLVHNDQVEVDVGALGQLTLAGQWLNDPDQDQVREALSIPTARLRLEGRYDAFGFNLEVGLLGEDPSAPNRLDPALLVLSFNVPLFRSEHTYLKAGQFKVPYGREELTYAGNLQFDRGSVESLGFQVGYDLGAAVVSNQGPVTIIGGVFTGAGREVPLDRFVPQTFGVPLLVARIGVGQVEDDPFYLHQNDFLWDRDKAALSINALYTRDSLIGQTSLLNAKVEDKSLLLSSAWNPYLGALPLDPGDWWQMGGDAALRMAFGDMLFSSELQFDYGAFSNRYGTLHMTGGRAQGGVGSGRLEISFRYSFLMPEGGFADGGVFITGARRPIHELTPAATWYFRGQALKAVLDIPVILNDVVFTEPGVGAFAATDDPSRAAQLSQGATVGRQAVVEARLQLQAQF